MKKKGNDACLHGCVVRTFYKIPERIIQRQRLLNSNWMFIEKLINFFLFSLCSYCAISQQAFT